MWIVPLAFVTVRLPVVAVVEKPELSILLGRAADVFLCRD
jgi:hypothetical protein